VSILISWLSAPSIAPDIQYVWTIPTFTLRDEPKGKWATSPFGGWVQVQSIRAARLVAPLPRALKIPGVMDLRALADVRALLKHLPKGTLQKSTSSS
jgi:hypothetical protein